MIQFYYKFCLLLFAWLLPTVCVSQNFKGHYVSIHSDTVACTYKLKSISKRSGDINVLLFKNHIKLEDAQGIKEFKPFQLKSFNITKNDGDELKFVAQYLKGQHVFVEELETGFVDIYKEYKLNPFDGSMDFDLLVKVEGKKVLRLNHKGFRKTLLAYLGNPEFLQQKIKRKTNYTKLPEILENYNNAFR